MALFVLVCFYVLGLWFGLYCLPGPFLGLRCFRSCCIYVAGLIQAVLFYLRVVVLRSVGVACSGGGGGLLVRVFLRFASLCGVYP